tara:strand:+ start:15092 stop:15544 length:453 start_codon:yes stop_codon:yes gene_type:complete
MADDDENDNDLFDLDLDEEEDLDEDEDKDEDKDDDDDDDDEEEDIEDLYYEKDKYATDMIVKIVPPDKRRTSDRISLFEFVNVVGTRAEQISNGDEFYVPIGNLTSAMEIAEEEIRMRRCPIIVERKLATVGFIQYCEMWTVNEMILPEV